MSKMVRGGALACVLVGFLKPSLGPPNGGLRYFAVASQAMQSFSCTPSTPHLSLTAFSTTRSLSLSAPLRLNHRPVSRPLSRPLYRPLLSSPRVPLGAVATRQGRGNSVFGWQLRAETSGSASQPDHSRKNGETGTEGNTLPPLRYLGDERLMQRQGEVTEQEIGTAEFAQKLEMLREAMKHYGGIGIAAPQHSPKPVLRFVQPRAHIRQVKYKKPQSQYNLYQECGIDFGVGWWTRVFCFGIEGTNPRYPDAAAMPLQFWINPEIVWQSKETNWMWEGCLSVPGMRGWVERPKEVLMKGRNEKGEEIAVKLGGLPARVAQHEFDHIDGVLFPSRVPGQQFLVPQASIDGRAGWAEGWPSVGSHQTALGQLQDVP